MTDRARTAGVRPVRPGPTYGPRPVRPGGPRGPRPAPNRRTTPATSRQHRKQGKQRMS